MSIVIPVWNRESVVHRAIESVLRQACDQVEVIVVDDSSCDSSYAVAQRAAEKNSAVRVISNSRTKGAQGARNSGTLVASGEWIGYLDSDNEYERGLFQEVWKFIDDAADVVCWYSEVREDRTGKRCGEFAWDADGVIVQRLLDGTSYVDNSSCLIRRSKLLEIGLLDEECPSYQEFDTHIRLSQRCTYRTVPRHLTVYYKHENQLSADRLLDFLGMEYVLRKHRNLWYEHRESTNWIKRCADLCASIPSVPNQRIRCLRLLLSLEPRLPWFLLKDKARRWLRSSISKLPRAVAVALRRVQQRFG